MSAMNNLEGIWRGIGALPGPRKTALALVTVLIMASIMTFVYFTNQEDYRVLFSNLTGQDASAIVSKLKEKKIPYQISPSGETISVPADKVSELRLDMAASGLPQGGGIGFEIFDNKTFGTTEFEQKINYRRALQGELSRTINSLDEVQQCRVHIVVPRETLFIEQQNKPTASVTIKLKNGRKLGESQIEGISHLVASSVEGLNADEVMIVDNHGNILSKRQGGDSAQSRLSSSQMEYQRNIEKEMATKIQTLLESVVGRGNAAVRVTADVDFRLMEKTEEIFDPESPVIRSSQKMVDKSTVAQSGTGKVDSFGPEKEKTDETLNYEINRTISKVVMPVGEIKKISIAVLVDGIYQKDDKGQSVYQERPKKELESFEDLVRKSAGFNAQRGDQVVVSSMPFNRTDTEEGMIAPSWQDKIVSVTPMIKYAALVFGLLLTYFFIIRPLMRDVISTARRVEANELRQITPEAGVSASLGGPSPQIALSPLDEKPLNEVALAKQLAEADSKKFAELLRNWLK